MSLSAAVSNSKILIQGVTDCDYFMSNAITVGCHLHLEIQVHGVPVDQGQL